MFFAVTVMGGYHLWSIANAETTVESQDHEHYRKIAKSRGDVRVLFSFRNARGLINVTGIR